MLQMKNKFEVVREEAKKRKKKNIREVNLETNHRYSWLSANFLLEIRFEAEGFQSGRRNAIFSLCTEVDRN